MCSFSQYTYILILLNNDFNTFFQISGKSKEEFALVNKGEEKTQLHEELLDQIKNTNVQQTLRKMLLFEQNHRIDFT